jgi:para-aminobenzoate synthetase component I
LEKIPKYLFYFNPNEHSNGFKKQLLVAETANDNLMGQVESAFFISYDFKNQIEPSLQSKNHTFVNLPNIVSILPEKKYLEQAANNYLSQLYSIRESKPLVFSSLSKAEYCQRFDEIIQHIQLGDIYEMNYCIAFHAKGKINPYTTYNALNAISHAPFSAFVKLDQQYIISSSPERFLQRVNNKLISQPIKGTSPRYADVERDLQSEAFLKSSLKDKTENVMIVDVARHDLSKIAQRNSVIVEDLYSVQKYDQVYQMVSTVACILKPECALSEIINATFPMASMTGAPKIRAMELIDDYENFSRGAYSGTIGYTDNDSLDSSVLIRSIFYNEATEDVWFAVGSAITAASNADDEWNELMLKAKAMQTVLIM